MADNLNQCVEVCTGKTSAGYGQSIITVGRRANYAMLAHVVAYEQMFGVSAQGKVVMHTCDRPSCVNPFHLRLGTQADNMKDCSNKGRLNSHNTYKTHCVNGHEFTDENTYWAGTRRQCRACAKARKESLRA